MNRYESETCPIVRCKIIPFPGVILPDFYNNPVMDTAAVSYPALRNIILARPGERLPDFIPDFRRDLQRDGLILLSWDKKIIGEEELYTAYWVTSSGTHRYYASVPMNGKYFPAAIPSRKSYAAEDGIEFYGEKNPEYIVHVAPELMMSSPEKIKKRPEHIRKLRSLGITVNFDYPFLLTTERKKNAVC